MASRNFGECNVLRELHRVAFWDNLQGKEDTRIPKDNESDLVLGCSICGQILVSNSISTLNCGI